ncbi:hypothetical protein A2Y99_02955 [Candidatus Gottesmanbacteria bacterium RBG_13_37_7]|uniref:DUF6798 domain-containing protein n=1 Tax=Candidatus Gottesmanbacteria bacterium RBG_13_37_7 TaxID=1798369 RepID=A0A1F5YJK6_9BACT|nr:MAG: hypothetical protein A2Y99_02955 [Candidatus Gottesmanbacteria bacterium RBG_13_37_7]
MVSILILLSIIFPLIYKYSFVITDQFTQIPIILSFLNRSYLLNDWYVNTCRNLGPRTFYAYYMAITAKLLSLPIAYFCHYIFFIFLIIMATYKLSNILFRNNYISLLTIITILFSSTYSLGGNVFISADFYAARLPLGFLLVGITSLFEKKYYLSAISFAIASYFHLHIGIIGGAIVFLAYFLSKFIFLNRDRFSEPNRQQFIELGKSFLFFLILIFPLYLLFRNEINPNVIKNQQGNLIDIIVYMRAPNHYLPSSWPLQHYYWFLGMLLLFGYFLWKLYRENRAIILYLFILTIIILLLCIIGYIGIDLFPIYFIIISQFYRLTLVICWMSLILISGSIYHRVFIQKSDRILLLIPFFLTNIKDFQPSKTWMLSVIMLILLIFMVRFIPKYLFILILLISFSLHRYHNKLNITSFIDHPTIETSLAQWVEAKTPENSLFLIPPDFQKFRLVAKHPIVVDWKAFPFQKSAILEWGERICDIANQVKCNFRYMSLDKAIQGYNSLEITDLERIHQKYPFDYIVSAKSLALTIEYSEGNYFIYKWPKESDQKVF